MKKSRSTKMMCCNAAMLTCIPHIAIGRSSLANEKNGTRPMAISP
jgi:hypothetical protein